jgi:hypothetical protein
VGDGEVSATLPTGDLRVTSTDAEPGASVSYTVTVRGARSGPGTVTTELEGPGLPGTTVVVATVTVNRTRSNAAA